MDPDKLGKIIQERRKDLGMTQGELGEKLSVTDKAISRWERGVGFPDIKLIVPLADALQISVEELLQCQREQWGNGAEKDHSEKYFLRKTNRRGVMAVLCFGGYMFFEYLRNRPVFAVHLGWLSYVSKLLFLMMICVFLYVAYERKEKYADV